MCFMYYFQRVKERKTYTDHELDDDEIEGKRSYKIEDKLASDRYSKDYVKKLAGEGKTSRCKRFALRKLI